MYELFLKSVTDKVNLTEQEKELLKSFLIPKKLRKNQYLLQEGDDCKYVAFVEKGSLRQYSLDEDGSVHIVQFAIEGWTIGDLYSFLTGEKSIYNIDALEDSELILIDHRSHETLLKQLPKYETYTRLQITGAYIAMQKRITSIFGMSIEDRYKAFTELYPDIIKRVPQHMIASYLGLQPETLSRIRKKIANR